MVRAAMYLSLVSVKLNNMNQGTAQAIYTCMCTYLLNNWEMMGKSCNRQGFPPPSTSNEEGGSLARRAWHIARRGKALRGDPVVLSQSEVRLVMEVLRCSDPPLVLRSMTT